MKARPTIAPSALPASKLQRAQEYGRQGFAIFPCAPGAKVPLIKNNLALATADPAQIAAWWEEYPEANIGCVPGKSCGGCFVLDVDVKHGQNGFGTLFELEEEHGALPPTLTVSTPSGGMHHWFKGSAATSAGKLGYGLDTRGSEGYVLLPGSALDDGGSYTVTNEVLIAEAPAWITVALQTIERAKTANTTALNSELNIARAIAFLEKARPAVEGQGGDALTVNTAMWLKDFMISEALALDLMAEHWNQRCSPPWDLDELGVKVENGYAYASNEAGSKALPDPLEEFAAFAARAALAEDDAAILRPQKDDAAKWQFSLFDPVVDANLPPITYRDENKLWPDSPEKTTTQVIAAPKEHKTGFVLSEMAQLAKRGVARVLILALEGQYGVRSQRLRAISTHFGIPLEGMRGRFQVVKIESGGMFNLADEDCVKAFTEWVRAGDWTDVVIDTQHRAAGKLEENSASDARVLWNAVEIIRTLGRVNVTLCHHTGKDRSKGGRGSSADFASVDQLLELKVDKEKGFVKAKVAGRKDGVDGFSVLFRVHSGERGVPLILPATTEEQEALAKEAADTGAYSRKKVGCALSALKAYAPNTVTTSVLAAEMLTQARKHGPIKGSIESVERTLRRHANDIGSGLWAYLTMAMDEPVRPLQWSLPAGSDEDDDDEF